MVYKGIYKKINALPTRKLEKVELTKYSELRF